MLGRVLPCNLEAERAVIGALLSDASGMDDVAGILSPEAFYDKALELIYRVMADLYSRGEKIDLVTVMAGLKTAGTLEAVGGAYVLSQLSASVASSAHIAEHARFIHQAWVAREFIFACHEISNKAFDESLDISDTIDEATRRIEGISDRTNYAEREHTVTETSRTALELYEHRKRLSKEGIKTGITTGIHDLDRATNGGWRSGQLIILAARPAMGKTALALHFAKQAAKAGTPVLIFSLEMDNQALTNRLLFSECEISAERFASGKLTDDEEAKLFKARERLYGLPVTIDDTASISVHQMRNRARNAKIKRSCGLVIIDYLQLIDMRNQNKAYNREQEVAQVSRAAKIMAKELEIPVILLSQLSREVEKRGAKIPILSDLRESGAIEQDADVVAFIHRPEYYNKDSEKGKGIIRIAKQRDGATGDIAFWYNYNLTRIADEGESVNMPF
jgi:replicative DNA helicase